VTDLSGFTRLTKAHGIVHFLSIFRRCVRLATPCIAQQGGRLLKFAADNMIALFPEPGQALAAARGMLDAADRDNAQHPAEQHVRICCGVGYGEMLMLEDDCFGDEVNVAFKLGEDVARPFEILCSAAAAARMRATGGPALADRRTEETGGVPLEHFAAPRA
jgi:class 3 adenylate cyclase